MVALRGADLEQRAREIAASLRSPIEVSLAYEGCAETFEGNAADQARAGQRTRVVLDEREAAARNGQCDG